MDRTLEAMVSSGMYVNPLRGSFSLPSLADGSEAISEAEEIHEVKTLLEKGDKAMSVKDYEEAILYYDEALEIDSRNTDVMHARSLVYLEMGQLKQAEEDADTIISLSPRNSQGYSLFGLTLQRQNRNAEALDAFLTSLDLEPDNADILTSHIVSVAAELCRMSDEFTESLNEMDAYKKLSEVGVYLFQNKKFSLCIKILEAAQKFQTNQKGITMRILLTMANAHTMLQHKDQAISLYLECLTMAVATHDQLYQTKSLVNIATLYLENSDTHLAIIYYEKLLHLKVELLEEVGSDDSLPDFWTRELQCGLHLNLSIAYKQIGNMSSAVLHARKYIRFIEKYDMKGKSRADSYHNTGMLNEILGKYDEALEDYTKYLNISKQNSEKKGISQAYGCLGSVYAALHNWPISITYHEQYIRMAEKSKHKKMLPIAHEMLADSYMLMENYDLAIEHYDLMIDTNVRGDYRTRATGLCKLGSAYRALDKYQYSQYFYTQACDMSEDFGLSDIQTLAEYNLASIQQYSTQIQDIEHARKYFEKLIPYFESKLQEHKEEDTHCPSEYEKQLLNCYDGIQMVLGKLGVKDECLQYAEAYRRRCVTQLPNFSPTPGQGMAISGMVSDVWTVNRMNRALSQQNATVLYYSLLEKTFLLWVLQPGLGLTRFYSGSSAKDCSIRSKIKQLLLELQKDFDWKNAQNRCENRALPLKDGILCHMRRKNESLSKRKTEEKPDCDSTADSSDTTPKKSAQRQLYNILLAPIEDILIKLDHKSHLVIIPDKELCHCPFTVLEDWNRAYVSDRFHVTYMPCFLLLDRVIKNEQEYLRTKDQLEFERESSRKGGAMKIIAQEKKDIFSSDRINPSEATFSYMSIGGDNVNLRAVSNPRFATSAVSPSVEKQRISPRLIPYKESAFKCVDGKPLSLNTEMSDPAHDHHVHQRLDTIKHALGQPVSPERMVGVHTFSTLTTRTSTGTDVTNSTLAVTLFRQISDKSKCVVYGCPELPDSLSLLGKQWSPHGELKNAQREAHLVGNLLETDPVVGKMATKIQFLKDIQQASILHIATHGCWKEGLLVFCPDPDNVQEGPPDVSSYIVSPADIHNIKLNAQLVVLNCGYTPSRKDMLTSLVLPSVFLSAGAQCVLVPQWLVPDDALQKFFHHFYMALQNGCLLSTAVKTAMHEVRQSERFSAVCNWSPFALFGKDVFVDVKQIRQAMLDQKIDAAEVEVEAETCTELLNPRSVIPHISTKEENFTRLQELLGDLIRHHFKQPAVIGGLIDSLDAALKRLHTEENNKQTCCLSQEISTSTGGLGLLKILGFHFQAKGAELSTPYVVFPHWNIDEMLIPAYDALRALTELVKNRSCSQAFCDIVPISQDHISMMVDLLSITKHAADIQLKVTDLSIRPLWQNTQIKNLLVAAGFHQIGLLLNFNKIPQNRLILTTLLQLLLAVSLHKSQILLYRLDVNLLGRSSASKQSLYDSMDQIRLPSLTPLILPRNQLRISTPWLSTVESLDEMSVKMRIAKAKSNLDEDFEDYLERAKTWHEMTIVAQANESLDKVGRPKTTPAKVKVLPGGSASRDRIPVSRENVLEILDIDQRRDYANYVFQQRLDNIDNRHKDETMKIYLPYINA
ncbi:tetratricopeptide repeat protein 28-like [Gigantopelta aegis]|uniref:tetratricopeptide repeat protein 28-like n=1 Tax=Gigantopelta aegis TaxID=1735272 RepID=UPI001B88AF2C|nr:tetratricopeptide repeat protein 28-like [Gigantopelta aegis]